GVGALDPGSYLDDQAAKSPDGTKVVFARRSSATGPSQLWTIDADGRNPVQLTSTGDNTAPAWSPDGGKIAFQSTRTGSKGYDIWVASWNGSILSDLANLTNMTPDDLTPTWSPANIGRIAFASTREGKQFEIYSMTTSGGSVVKLTDDPRPVRDPSWSPNGAKIAFSGNRTGGGGFDIYVMDASTGANTVRLTTING